MSTNLPRPRLFEVKEVCEMLRISRTTLWKLVKAKKIKVTRIYKRVLFSQKQIDDFLNSYA